LITMAMAQDRLFWNYIANPGNLFYIDWNFSLQKVTRAAYIPPLGNPNLVTTSGYTTADDSNVWGLQYNTEFNNEQATVFSHTTCLGDVITLPNNIMSSIGLDPNNMQFYASYTSQVNISRFNYDGTGMVTFPYAASNSYQIMVDYIRLKIALLSSPTASYFSILDLTTNLTSLVNFTAPLNGGIGLDINYGKFYAATASTLYSFDPASGISATAYVNTDFTFRGFTIDSTNGQLFFAANRQSKADSQIFAVPIVLPGGTVSATPVAAQPIAATSFVSIAVAHCPKGGCGMCGSLINPPNGASIMTLSYVIALASFLAFIV